MNETGRWECRLDRSGTVVAIDPDLVGWGGRALSRLRGHPFWDLVDGLAGPVLEEDLARWRQRGWALVVVRAGRRRRAVLAEWPDGTCAPEELVRLHILPGIGASTATVERWFRQTCTWWRSPLVMQDQEGRIVAANQASGVLFGRDPHAIVGRCRHDLTESASSATVIAHYPAERLEILGCRLRVGDHRGRRLRWAAWSVPTAEGCCHLVMLEELVPSAGSIDEDPAQRLRVACAGDCLGTWSWEGGMLHLDHGARVLCGVEPTRERVPVASFIAAVHRRDRRGLLASLRRLRADRGRFACEVRLRDTLGAWRWLTVGGINHQWIEDDDRVCGYVVPLAGAGQVYEHASAAANLIKRLPDRLLLLDRNGGIHAAHVPGQGVRFDDTGGVVAHLREEVPDSVLALALDQLALASDTGTGQCFDFSRLDHSGARRYYQFRLVPTGEHQILAIITDVTERKVIELALVRSRYQAVHTRRVQNVALAAIGHDIRSPVTGAMGMLEELMREELAARQHAMVGHALAAMRCQVGLLDDLLDLTAMQSGQLAFREQTVRLGEVAREVLAAFAGQAEAKDLDLSARIAAAVETPVRADPVRLRQLIQNLVGNAVKFTDSGQVRLDLDGDLDESDLHVTIEVADCGPGIAPGDRQVVFHPFVSLGSPHRGGYGMGLAICRSIVEHYAGSVVCAPRSEGGTVFRAICHLPRQGEDRALEPRMASEFSSSQLVRGCSLRGHRVLVVEDDPQVQRLLEVVLSGLGATVTVAGDGLAALHASENQAFTLIFLDGHLPRLDGWMVARFLRRADANPNRGTPVVAITGQDGVDVRRATLNAGMDDILAKPFTRRRLMTVLQVWTGLTPLRAPDEEVRVGAERPVITAQVADTVDLLGGEEAGWRAYLGLLGSFRREAPGLFVQLHGAHADGDHRLGAELAHRLGSCAAMLGLGRLRSRAREYEHTCDEGRALSAVAVDDLERHYHDDIAAFDAWLSREAPLL